MGFCHRTLPTQAAACCCRSALAAQVTVPYDRSLPTASEDLPISGALAPAGGATPEQFHLAYDNAGGMYVSWAQGAPCWRNAQSDQLSARLCPACATPSLQAFRSTFSSITTWWAPHSKSSPAWPAAGMSIGSACLLVRSKAHRKIAEPNKPPMKSQDCATPGQL